MNKKWSLSLGKYAGIKLFVHWTFPILIIWVFLMYSRMGNNFSDGVMGVLFIMVLFICVVLHEFGHALTAKRFHIKTRDITLYPIGGIASLENMPENPRQELLVALAGPAVNVVIAAILWIYLTLSGSMPDLSTLQTADQMQALPFVFSLLAANVVLVVFNMIPAFPMDGGRVLRALLAFRMNRASATRLAAGIGRIFAIIFVLFGFLFNFWLVLIGLFIYMSASGEATYETTKDVLRNLSVKDVLMTKYTVLSPDDTLEKAVQILLDGQEREFLVVQNDLVMGILTRKALISGLSDFGKTDLVSNVMQKEFMTLTPEMRLKDIFSKMLRNDSTVYPVQKEGRLLGMVNRENVNELIMVKQAALPDQKI